MKGGIKPGGTGSFAAAAGAGGTAAALATFAQIGLIVFAVVEIVILLADRNRGGDGNPKGGGSGNSNTSSARREPIVITNSIAIDWEGDRRRREQQERIIMEAYLREQEEQRIQKRNAITGMIVCGIAAFLVFYYSSPLSVVSSILFSPFTLIKFIFSFAWNNLTLLAGLLSMCFTIAYYNNGYQVKDERTAIQKHYEQSLHK